MNVLKPHFSLNVSDIEASVAFHEKAFSVAATKRGPGYAKFDLQRPALNLTTQDDSDAREVVVVKADASVIKADASTCCAPGGLSRRPIAASTCCSPTP